jgi:Fe-S-cluster containining protein
MSINLFNPDELYKEATKQSAATKKFFLKLKKVSPRVLDDTIQFLHNEVFLEIDCLSCALCCKHLGPLVKQKDIDRISKYLKIKPAAFIEKYLRIDEDGDFVFKTKHCPFLLSDNFCSIYEVCPKACSEYPHTDQIGSHRLLSLTQKNMFYCPAVFQIVEKLKKTNIV